MWLAAAGTTLLTTVLTKAADNILDYSVCESVSDEKLRGQIEKMDRRRDEEKAGDFASAAFCMSEKFNIDDLASELSTRKPFIGCTVRLIRMEGTHRRIKTGQTLHSCMSKEELSSQLQSLINAFERFSRDPQIASSAWHVETTTSSADGDQESEQLLSFAIGKVVRHMCETDVFKNLEYKEIGKDVEQTHGCAGTILAKVLDRNKSISSLETKNELRNIFVTGQTGAGKSTVCGVLNECKLDSFHRNKGSTGTTAIRRAELIKNGTSYRIIDSPGLGDRHGGDPIILSELAKEARIRQKISVHLHVYKHTPDRAGADASRMSRLYGRAFGDGVVKRLVVVVTFTADDVTGIQDTIDGWIDYIARVAVIPFEIARERVVALNLDDPIKKEAADDLWRVCEVSAGYGSMDMYESVAKRELLKQLARDESHYASAACTRLKHIHVADWQSLIADDFGSGTPSVSCKENFVSIDTNAGFRMFLNRVTKTYFFHCSTNEEAHEFAKNARRYSRYGVKALYGLFLKGDKVPIALTPENLDEQFRQTYFTSSENYYFRLASEQILKEMAREEIANDVEKLENVSYTDFEAFIKDNYSGYARP